MIFVSYSHADEAWRKRNGQPIPNPAKEPQVDGALVTSNQGGATNWPPPSFAS
jgi:hypothetical protein